MRYPITPVPKPRQTQSDRWKVRPCVARYRAFADECRVRGVMIDDSVKVRFGISMPTSWSKRKRESMDGQPHQQRPDIDNLLKALMDAILPDDAFVWFVWAQKVWANEGFIEVLE